MILWKDIDEETWAMAYQGLERLPGGWRPREAEVRVDGQEATALLGGVEGEPTKVRVEIWWADGYAGASREFDLNENRPQALLEELPAETTRAKLVLLGFHTHHVSDPPARENSVG